MRHGPTVDIAAVPEGKVVKNRLHLASRYRDRGLDKTAARMVGYRADRGVGGAVSLR